MLAVKVLCLLSLQSWLEWVGCLLHPVIHTGEALWTIFAEPGERFECLFESV